MSPDIPLKIVEWFLQYDIIGFLLGLMALSAIFRGWHFYKLLSGESEKHQAVFAEAKHLVRSEYWGRRYQLFLKGLLSGVARLIGDGYRFPDELPRMRADDSALERLQEPPDTIKRVLGVNPLTVESYQFCFLMASLYPVLSFFVGWMVGGNSLLGTLELLAADTPQWQRWGWILVFALSLSLVISSRQKTGWQRYVIGVSVVVGGGAFLGGIMSETFVVGGFITALVVVSVIFFVFVLDDNNTDAAANVVTTAAAANVVTTAAVTAVAVAALAGLTNTTFTLFLYVVNPVFLVVFFGLRWFYWKAFKKRELSTYWFFYTLVFLTTSLVSLIWLDSSTATIFLLFCLILPLINTPFDWLSLGITRALLQSIRFNHHRFGKAILWSLLDLGLALLALFLVSGATVSIVSIANLLAIKPVVDFNEIFTSLSSLENWKDNLWIYFMLLSTLIPTAIHFALAGGALTLSVSRKKRNEILQGMESNDLRAKEAWLYVSIMPAVGFVLAPTLLFYGLYLLLHTHGAWLGQILLSWATVLATFIDPTLGHIPQGAV